MKSGKSESFAKIICVFNQKGGVGKTTTTCQLAGTLGHRGYDVLVADLDPQQSSSAWVSRSAQEEYPFPATLWTGWRYGKEGVAPELQKLASKYEVIVIDCAPSVDSPGTWASLLVSDLAIVPTKLGPADLDALPAALELGKEAIKASRRTFPIRVLATAYRKSRADERQALEQLSTTPSYPEFPVLSSSLGDRVAFTRSMLYGQTAHSMPKAAEAVTEIDALADEICDLLNLPREKEA